MGNAKYDSIASRVSGEAWSLKAAQLKVGADTLVLVAGSTHEGEEAVVLKVYRELLREWPGLRLILVPRHPERGAAVRDLAAQGHQLIFAASFGYLEPALRVAADFPQVKFEHAGGYKTAPNLNTYNARFYEGRWLAGWLAGRASRSGVAGYVAGFPVPEVVQGINAFAQGMRAANPLPRL